MGFFKKTQKKKQAAPVERKSVFDGRTIDTGNWKQVFSACLGKMMAVQTACSDLVVRGQDWNVDFESGFISFGQDKYPIQFIGSESASSGTWLWGWENINGFNETILETAEETKRKGKAWGLEPLTIAEFELDDTFNGHNLSIAACGISDRELCYYRGPHAGGAVFIAFGNVPKEVFAPVGMVKFTNLTMQCIQQFAVDHKIFVESFLMWNGTAYEKTESRFTAHFEQDLAIEFEEAGGFFRISGIKTL
ncbi:hypothetical protein V3C10_19810 [[Clostridium] symbiosum]|uniref:DUF6882 domain-containing protein n=1 Tax=Clostridium symbiosum TaxID=1512 RepID=UPI001D05E775|nr:DUF6882 domain-containing protein [[Clostridium] symbiosum]MCB6611633.1 hypothetical protein [[Clostridium] symbiosum]MCB6930441.1 hypothetical protein [[Clostridium] symbiosum]